MRRAGAEESSLRSTFGSSSLVRLLGEWAPVEPDAAGMDVAERLSLWFGAFDAIRLQAAHQAIRAIEPPAAGARPDAARQRARSLAQDVERVRGALAHAIAQDPVQLAAGPGLRQAAGRVEPPTWGESPNLADVTYALYQQRHAELQRQMDLMIAPLREHVRQAVVRAAPRLKPLAAIDAALQEALGGREQALLSAVSVLPERRFEQLRAAHRERVAAQGEADEPATWRRSGAWLHAFEADWRAALRAEVDLRLEPVQGLVEALANDNG